MTDLTDRIVSLQALLVDAREGYEEGCERAEAPEMVALFTELRDMNTAHAGELARALIARGVEPDADGTFLKYVHKTILTVRSALGGLGPSVIPGLVDGERRILSHYDAALEAEPDPDLRDILVRQRAVVAARVLGMEAMEQKAKA